MTLLLALEAGNLGKRDTDTCSSQGRRQGVDSRNALASFFIQQTNIEHKQVRRNSIKGNDKGFIMMEEDQW
jgi:hypothetical protein